MFILHDIDANRSHLLHTVDVFATKHLTYAEIIEEIIILESIYEIVASKYATGFIYYAFIFKVIIILFAFVTKILSSGVSSTISLDFPPYPKSFFVNCEYWKGKNVCCLSQIHFI